MFLRSAGRRCAVVSRQTLPPLRRFLSNSSSSSSEGTPLPKTATPTTSTNEGGSPWMARFFWSAMAGAVLGGAYRMTRPLDEEPPRFHQDRVTGEPLSLHQRLGKRAYFRFMSLYKSLVDPPAGELLPDVLPPTHHLYRPKTLVVELDKVLVHSAWDRANGWSVAKRPWGDYFLAHMSRYYEVVVFSSQSPMYAEPIVNKLDGGLGAVMYRLYNDSLVYDIELGEQIKDLSMLNRNLKDVVVLDTKAHATLHPENIIQVPEWEGDKPEDTWLLDMIPFLESLAFMEDVRQVLPAFTGKNIPSIMAERARLEKEDRLRETITKKADAAVAGDSGSVGWKAAATGFLLDLFGLRRFSGGASRQQSMTSEEMLAQKALEVEDFQRTLEYHKKLQEEERLAQEAEQKRIMEKAGDIRITLWDMLTKGVDAAIMEKADPEVRAFMVQNLALQQQQQ